MWFEEEEVSRWAYEQCLDSTNSEVYVDLITHSYWASRYCKDISNDKKVRKRIKFRVLKKYFSEPEELYEFKECLPLGTRIITLTYIIVHWSIILLILIILFPFMFLISLYEWFQEKYWGIKRRIKEYVARKKGI